jgi:hypothetical protein
MASQKPNYNLVQCPLYIKKKTLFQDHLMSLETLTSEPLLAWQIDFSRAIE